MDPGTFPTRRWRVPLRLWPLLGLLGAVVVGSLVVVWRESRQLDRALGPVAIAHLQSSRDLTELHDRVLFAHLKIKEMKTDDTPRATGGYLDPLQVINTRSLVESLQRIQATHATMERRAGALLRELPLFPTLTRQIELLTPLIERLEGEISLNQRRALLSTADTELVGLEVTLRALLQAQDHLEAEVIAGARESSRSGQQALLLAGGAVLALSLTLAGVSGRAYRDQLRQVRERIQQSETAAQALARLNSAYARFVPHELLDLLGKQSILEVRIGDQVTREMTVLFSDIRGFTPLAEQLTSAASFAFLSAYLQRLGPLVRQQGGFIDKYQGDGIMALFPHRVEDALETALAMVDALARFNEGRVAEGGAPVQIGVGIHVGEMVLGTIGYEEQMQGTVVSDAVNLAARLEGLTKRYGTTVLLSEAVRVRLATPDSYEMRFLGEVQVKGKVQATAIYELLAADAPATWAGKRASQAAFEGAVACYCQGDIAAALPVLRAIVQAHPADAPGRYLLAQCEQQGSAI
ncbi:MAG: adenylate/guanylate cyclase domain-containing protein [Ardenticatenales bacterium]|nr:adenylate/guanylate cyclase domain-containing protein [Ardenticatenales bacterium]